MDMKIRWVYFSALLFYLTGQASADKVVHFPVSKQGLRFLTASAKIKHADIAESSGLARCSWNENYLWTINDSGAKPQIYLINKDGKSPAGWEKGITIRGAVNEDWEDIALTKTGELIIADLGNNKNLRGNLTLYFFPEPRTPSEEIDITRKQHVHYPEQKEFPPKKKNFDSEAIFPQGDDLYLCTKNRADSFTSVYKIERDTKALTKIVTLNIRGQVTGADTSPDETRLALLTYSGLWVFEKKDGQPFWEGTVRFMPIFAYQCEGIAFLNNETIVISNEQRSLYTVKVSDIKLLH